MPSKASCWVVPHFEKIKLLPPIVERLHTRPPQPCVLYARVPPAFQVEVVGDGADPDVFPEPHFVGHPAGGGAQHLQQPARHRHLPGALVSQKEWKFGKLFIARWGRFPIVIPP